MPPRKEIEKFPDREALLFSAFLSSVLLFLAWMNAQNPFLYSTKLAKIFMYSVTFFWPIVVYTLLQVAGLRLHSAGLYIIVFIFHFTVFYSFLFFHKRAEPKNKGRILSFGIAAAALFTLIAIFYLW